MTPEQLEAARLASEAGESHLSIARRFGVSTTALHLEPRTPYAKHIARLEKENARLRAENRRLRRLLAAELEKMRAALGVA